MGRQEMMAFRRVFAHAKLIKVARAALMVIAIAVDG